MNFKSQLAERSYKRIVVFFLVLLGLNAALPALAVDNPRSLWGGLDVVRNQIANQDQAIIDDTSPRTVIENIINFILSFAAVLALLVLVVGGFLYIVSFGDEDRAALGKKMIFYAIVGLIIIGLSFAIILFVRDLLLGNA